MFSVANIKKLKVYNIPEIELSKVVDQLLTVDESHLREKPFWYEIDGSLHYFKRRNDDRLISELFNTSLYRETGLPAASYYPATVNGSVGLLTPIKLDHDKYEYFDFDHLYSTNRDGIRQFGKYSLKGLIAFYENILGVRGAKQVREQLVQLYVDDYYSLQQDRNKKNFLMKRDLMTGEISLHDIYDNERSLGVVAGKKSQADNSKWAFSSDMPEFWEPSMPYESKEDNGNTEGVDNHMLGLVIDYPDIAISAMQRVMTIDTDGQLRSHSSGRHALNFGEREVDHIRGFFDSRKEAMHRVLKIGI